MKKINSCFGVKKGPQKESATSYFKNEEATYKSRTVRKILRSLFNTYGGCCFLISTSILGVIAAIVITLFMYEPTSYMKKGHKYTNVFPWITVHDSECPCLKETP